MCQRAGQRSPAEGRSGIPPPQGQGASTGGDPSGGFDTELTAPTTARAGSWGRSSVPSGGCPTTSTSSSKRWQKSSPPNTAASALTRTSTAGKKPNVAAAFFLSHIYRSWRPVAHCGWSRLMLESWCLVEVPNAPHHRAEERAHTNTDYERRRRPLAAAPTPRPATMVSLGIILSRMLRWRPVLCVA